MFFTNAKSSNTKQAVRSPIGGVFFPGESLFFSTHGKMSLCEKSCVFFRCWKKRRLNTSSTYKIGRFFEPVRSRPALNEQEFPKHRKIFVTIFFPIQNVYFVNSLNSYLLVAFFFFVLHEFNSGPTFLFGILLWRFIPRNFDIRCNLGLTTLFFLKRTSFSLSINGQVDRKFLLKIPAVFKRETK